MTIFGLKQLKFQSIQGIVECLPALISKIRPNYVAPFLKILSVSSKSADVSEIDDKKFLKPKI